MPLTAVIWDFDGTLVDTCEKNLSVTREIIENLTGHSPDDMPILRSVEVYDRAVRAATNWRDMYRDAFSFDESEIDEAGSMWAEYQVRNRTPVTPFDGIAGVLDELRDIPQGIVSQNAHASITAILGSAGLLGYFGCIVGYEEVPLSRQKPEPDGLLFCIEDLTSFAAGTVLYVGDHPVDARCAETANRVLAGMHPHVKVVMLAATYGSDGPDTDWSAELEHTTSTPSGIAVLANGLR